MRMLSSNGCSPGGEGVRVRRADDLADALAQRLRLRRSQHPLGGRVHEGDAALGVEREKTGAQAVRNRSGEVQLVAELPLHPFTLDALSHRIRDGGQRLERVLPKRFAGEGSQNPHEPAFNRQRVAGEGNDPDPPGPILAAHPRGVEEVVGPSWPTLAGDEADVGFPDRHAVERTIGEARDARAGLKLQYAVFVVEGPDANARRVEVLDDGLRAAPQDHG